MCTAISVVSGDHYFGRNLDFEYGFGEKVVIAPREFPFRFRCGEAVKNHDAIIGIGIVANGYPLWFDAVNESGLAMAGLMFSGSCVYQKKAEDKRNIASFELIPWIITKCRSVDEAEREVACINITDEAFSTEMPPSPLHWIISDKSRSITLEVTENGTRIYDNPVGVLTNNPEFDMQMFNLNNFRGISPENPKNSFSQRLSLETYSRGMGGIGLPGDLSSVSRFVKCAFICENSVYAESETGIVNHFFHTLYSVFQQRGCVRTEEDFEITRYSSCCNTSRGIYYYTTYENSNITAVDMHLEDLDAGDLVEYELDRSCDITVQNRK